MDAFQCHLPRIEFGSGRLDALGGLVAPIGKRAFLAIDPYLDRLGLGEQVERILGSAGIDVAKFADIQPNPSCFGADEAAGLAREQGCEMVVAVGGGSTMDFGKGVAVLATNPATC